MLEIEDILDSHARRVKNKFKDDAVKICSLAHAVAVDHISVRYGDGKTLMPWDLYPEFFEKEKEHYDQKYSEDRFDDYKQQRKEYAAKMNAKRKGGVGNV